MTHPLPHDAYITAITEALSLAQLTPAEYWTSDGETRGVYCHLNAVITLDPGKTYDLDDEDVPAGTAWRHGLMLSWEWHTGAEDGWEKGPFWEFAEMESNSRNAYPTGLPVEGYASPDAIVDAARKVIAHEIKPGHQFNSGLADWDGGIIGGPWEHADELDAACEAWGADEGQTVDD